MLSISAMTSAASFEARKSISRRAASFSAASARMAAEKVVVSCSSSGRGIGTFEVILAVADAANCVNRDTINVTFDLCDGIGSILSQSNFAVYPNPSSQEFSFTGDRPATISVYDMKGSLLFTREYRSGTIAFGEAFPAGSYLLKVINDKTAYHTLIIKN